jgi:hypothetical protein
MDSHLTPPPNSSSPDSQEKSKRSLDCPWCWQRKQILRLIRDSFAATNDVPTALATYGALTKIASDEQRDQFKTTQVWIAGKAGCSPRTVGDHLAAFVELGIIEMIVPKLRGPAWFNLNTDAKLFPNDTQPLPNVLQPAAEKPPLQTLDESDDESSKNDSIKGKKKKAGASFSKNPSRLPSARSDGGFEVDPAFG